MLYYLEAHLPPPIRYGAAYRWVGTNIPGGGGSSTQPFNSASFYWAIPLYSPTAASIVRVHLTTLSTVSPRGICRIELWSALPNGRPNAIVAADAYTDNPNMVQASSMDQLDTITAIGGLASYIMDPTLRYYIVIRNVDAAPTTQYFTCRYLYNIVDSAGASGLYQSSNAGVTWTLLGVEGSACYLVELSNGVELGNACLQGAVVAMNDVNNNKIYGDRLLGIRTRIMTQAETVCGMQIHFEGLSATKQDLTARIYKNSTFCMERTFPSGAFTQSANLYTYYLPLPDVPVLLGDVVDIVLQSPGSSASDWYAPYGGSIIQGHRLNFVGIFSSSGYANAREMSVRYQENSSRWFPDIAMFTRPTAASVFGAGYSEQDAAIFDGASGSSLKVATSGWVPQEYKRIMAVDSGEWTYGVKMRYDSTKPNATGWPRVVLSGSAVGATAVIVQADGSASDSFYPYTTPLSLADGELTISYQCKPISTASGAVETPAWFDSETWE